MSHWRWRNSRTCLIKGFWDYALNRGGALAVDFDDGRFVFCFRPLREFAPPQ
ncbi:MAG: AF1514 family protein [Sideroxyarcus sp.]|nr:AF1514 family protein [Sideroxyarcus sp.]